MGGRPIANKYREGKMKRTLERELKVLEIAEREPKGSSAGWRLYCSVVSTAGAAAAALAGRVLCPRDAAHSEVGHPLGGI